MCELLLTEKALSKSELLYLEFSGGFLQNVQYFKVTTFTLLSFHPLIPQQL